MTVQELVIALAKFNLDAEVSVRDWPEGRMVAPDDITRLDRPLTLAEYSDGSVVILPDSGDSKLR